MADAAMVVNGRALLEPLANEVHGIGTRSGHGAPFLGIPRVHTGEDVNFSYAARVRPTSPTSGVR